MPSHLKSRYSSKLLHLAVLFQTVLSLMRCVGVFLAQGPWKGWQCYMCLVRLRSMGWIPAVLADASAPVELAVLAVTDQLGIPLLVWWGCVLKEAMYRQRWHRRQSLCHDARL